MPRGGPASATYFAYDGWNLVQEGYSPWSSSRFYIHGSRMDEIVQSYNSATGSLYYHYYDASGHCTMLTDTQGTIKEQYSYDAFGYPHFYNSSAQPLNASTFGNRFLFTGREWLSELRLYDFRNRLYNPELGRFMQPDPKEFAAGDYNLYRYCHNDPVNKTDPTGLTFWSNLRLLWDFITGSGATQRTYNGNTKEAQEMANSPRVKSARDAFNRNGHNNLQYRYGTGEAFRETVLKPAAPIGVLKMPLGPPIPIPNPTMFAADKLGSTAAQVGGFYDASIVNNGDGTATFSIHNDAGADSFFYHAVSDRTGTTGPFRTIHQDFTWTEKIDQ